jgi:HD-like signal output (HDOD) protein
MILAEWRFPIKTIEGIRDHYNPVNSDPLAQILNFAAGAAETGGYGFPGETEYWSTFSATGSQTLSLTPEDVAESLRHALELFGSVRAAVN